MQLFMNFHCQSPVKVPVSYLNSIVSSNRCRCGKNASRPPGEWQTYDIFFHAPRFDPDGRLAKPATITVIHNGVLVQDNVEIKGTTVNSGAPKYTAHPLKMPILLQDHGNPVNSATSGCGRSDDLDRPAGKLFRLGKEPSSRWLLLIVLGTALN